MTTLVLIPQGGVSFLSSNHIEIRLPEPLPSLSTVLVMRNSEVIGTATPVTPRTLMYEDYLDGPEGEVVYSAKVMSAEDVESATGPGYTIIRGIPNVEVKATFHEHTLVAAAVDGMYLASDESEGQPIGTVLGATYTNKGSTKIRFKILEWVTTSSAFYVINGGANVIPIGTRMWRHEGDGMLVELEEAQIQEIREGTAYDFGAVQHSAGIEVELQPGARLSSYTFSLTPLSSIVGEVEFTAEIVLNNNLRSNWDRVVQPV